jgi:insertion element IS1 protein InsB
MSWAKWHSFLGCLEWQSKLKQHTAVGKETGETAHVERWNDTLRQRLARFVRMTLSFSKSVVMHEACLLLFLHGYNLDRAILLK